MKEKNKNFKKIILIFKLFFMLLLLISIIMIGKWFLEKKKLNDKISSISKITKIEEISNVDSNGIIKQVKEIPQNNPYWKYINFNLINVDFTNLKNINNEVIAYLKVPGTDIDYSVVQHSDNDYYLKHSIDFSYSTAGWIFMDYRNNINNFDNNTIIYGHRMYDTSMFSTLKNVLNDEWLNNEDNHIVYLATENESSLWQIFSIYHIPDTTDFIETSFDSDDDYQNFIDLINDRSEYNFDSCPTTNDKILTLSTCYTTNTQKLVLHAKKIKQSIKN